MTTPHISNATFRDIGTRPKTYYAAGGSYRGAMPITTSSHPVSLGFGWLASLLRNHFQATSTCLLAPPVHPFVRFRSKALD
jgi:hypothetical protein